MLIDSHCHLDFPDFAPDIEGVLDRARAAGVERFIAISTRVARGDALVALADRFDDVYFTIGTHPHQAAEEPAVDVAAIRAFAAHPKCVGVGEAGLDYHYDYAPREVAARVFRAQIALARELSLPLVIHAREADEDIAAILLLPVMPASMERLLDLLAVPADERSFKALGGDGRIENGQRWAVGALLPAPTGVFPRFVDDAAS